MKTMGAMRNANRFMLVFLCWLVVTSVALGMIMGLFGVGKVTELILPELVCFLLPAIIAAAVFRKEAADMFPFKGVSLSNAALILIMTLFIQPGISLLAGLAANIFPDMISNIAETGLNQVGLAPMVLAMAVTPAICEEVVARGVFLYGYKDAGLLKACLLNGLFFGMIHMNFQQFVYAFVMGALFALFVRVTGSILASMMAHFAMNGTQIWGFYQSLNTEAADVAALGIPAIVVTIVQLVMTLAALSIFALALVVFLRRNGVLRPRAAAAEPEPLPAAEASAETDVDAEAALTISDRAATPPLFISVGVFAVISGLMWLSFWIAANHPELLEGIWQG